MAWAIFLALPYREARLGPTVQPGTAMTVKVMGLARDTSQPFPVSGYLSPNEHHCTITQLQLYEPKSLFLKFIDFVRQNTVHLGRKERTHDAPRTEPNFPHRGAHRA